jgi:predicted transcriptional regulator
VFHSVIDELFAELKKNSQQESDDMGPDCPKDNVIEVDDDSYGPDSVNVMLPLKFYEVSIQHRVLSELGVLSHFILSVMAKHNLTIQDIEEVTGLSDAQIRPIADRLKSLGLIDKSDNVLSEAGERAAYILENIHNEKINLYVDQNYSSQNHDWFIAIEGQNALEEISASCFTVPFPRRVSFNRFEDCFKQSQRFQKNYLEILPKILPEFNQVIEDYRSIWKEEWDVTFRSPACDKRMGIPIDLELKNYTVTEEISSKAISSTERNAKARNAENTLYLYTELLRLRVQFSLPQGIDFGAIETIEPKSFIYSDNDNEIYDEVGFEADVDEEKRLYSQGRCDSKQNALNLLAHSITCMDEDDQLYSRKNVFDKGWQRHEYTYEEVISSITTSKVIRIES